MWEDSYSIGVEFLDEQHKGLFEHTRNLLNTLLDDEISPEAYQAHITMSLTFLKNYALNHFEAEEAYAVEIGFEHIEEHKAMHDALKQSIAVHEIELVENDFDIPTVRGFLNFLIAWLVDHISNEDIKLRR